MQTLANVPNVLVPHYTFKSREEVRLRTCQQENSTDRTNYFTSWPHFQHEEAAVTRGITFCSGKFTNNNEFDPMKVSIDRSNLY